MCCHVGVPTLLIFLHGIDTDNFIMLDFTNIKLVQQELHRLLESVHL